MSVYNKVLVAVDFNAETDALVRKALTLAGGDITRLLVVHVVEPSPMFDSVEYPFPDVAELERMVEEQQRQRLDDLLIRLGVPGARTFLEAGSPKHEITRVAQEQGADLIVVGSHGRHGLRLLLGSTANGVLHLAQCDVLAVRVFDRD